MINTGSYNGYPGLLNADLFDRTETENIVPLSNNIIKTENIVPLSNGIIKTENIVPLSNGIIVDIFDLDIFDLDIFDLDIFGLRKIKNMIYELRTYQVVPGKMQNLNDRFKNITLPLFEKHNMKV